MTVRSTEAQGPHLAELSDIQKAETEDIVQNMILESVTTYRDTIWKQQQVSTMQGDYEQQIFERLP